jgi:hypothetical protein
MWLITTFILALASSVAALVLKNKLKLWNLSFMFWGAFIMILVDFVLGYEGGPFIEFEVEGLISNATVLGILMTIPVLVVWGVSNLLGKQKVQA